MIKPQSLFSLKVLGLIIPVIILAVFMCAVFTFAGSGTLKFEFDEFPTPSHSLKGVSRSVLVLEKVIKPDFDKNFFMAKPTALTVDNTGSIYVYDQLLRRIYKFDHNYRYICHFLKEGRGPGETLALDAGFNKLYYSENGSIYVSDAPAGKIIVFDTDGNYKNDIQIDDDFGNYYNPFIPVVDMAGNFYFLAHQNGILHQADPRMNVVHTYLNIEQNKRFVVYRPTPNAKVPQWLWLQPNNENTYYDVTRDNQLVIYLSRPSTVFVFHDRVLVRKFNILLKEPMEQFRTTMSDSDDMLKKHKKLVAVFGNMFNTFFIDKDNNNLLYLNDYDAREYPRLYQFSLEGQLTKVLVASEQYNCQILAKRNNLFYGLSLTEGHIYIFREEVNK